MDVPGWGACRCAVVGFEYIPVIPADLDPLFITSYPVVSTPCSEEAHTCVHLLYRRYHPVDFLDSSLNHSCTWCFSHFVGFLSLVLFLSSTCRRVGQILTFCFNV